MTREEVYKALDSERDYQIAGRGNAKRHEEFSNPLLPGEVILCMERILSEAREAWYRPDGLPYVAEDMRKLGAMAVQYGENYGMPARK